MKRFAFLSLCLFIVLSIGLSVASAAQYDSEIYQAQKALKARGYSPGIPDGLWGKSTESAIKHFQVDNDLPVTGKLDEQTKAKLGIVSTARSVKRNQQVQKRRLALVIGNSAYKSSPLINPVNDAQDMAAALKRLEFEVIHKENASQQAMEEAIFTFSNRLKKGGVGLFYYAGHGVQVNGRNYLIPIGASIRAQREIKYKAVDAGQVLDGMFDAGNGLNIVMLDACRDNPFARSFRTSSRGLGRMDAPTGSFIAYATAPGSVAADGTGRNGIYTKHLLKHMKTPGLTIERVLKRTRNDVMRETGNKQVPWQASSLTGDFYFASSGAVVSQPAETPSVSTIEISANVSGAQVLLDDRGVGATPVQGVEVSPGSHRIRVKKEGYDTYEKSVQVEAGRTFSMQVYLDKMKPRKGRLYVETDPKNAKVNMQGIDRFYQGIELEPGRYRVEVSASGYKTKAMWITLDAGEDKSLDIRTERVAASRIEEPSSRTKTWKDPVTGMEFVWVAGGCYEMGCGSWAGDCDNDEKPVHKVCLDGFWMGKYEVTQGQWKKVMGKNPSRFKASFLKNRDNYPVEKVSWNDAKDFISKLNSRSSYKFRLPTEAEWEHAARSGGKAEKYSGSNNVGAVAWYRENSGDTTHPVGTKAPNGLGIYDMSGNISEWCEDVYSKGAYSNPQRNNPISIYTEKGSLRVFRGGSWNDLAHGCRSAVRSRYTPGFGDGDLGFRLSRTP